MRESDDQTKLARLLVQVRGRLAHWSTRHGSATNEIDRNRDFLTTAFSGTLGIVGPLSGLVYWALGAEIFGYCALGLGIVCMGALVAIARGMRPRIAAHVLLWAFWLAFCIVLTGSRGTASPLLSAI